MERLGLATDTNHAALLSQEQNQDDLWKVNAASMARGDSEREDAVHILCLLTCLAVGRYNAFFIEESNNNAKMIPIVHGKHPSLP